MPGIIGLREFHPTTNPVSLLSAMAEAIRVRPTDVTSLYSDEPLYLGSVRLGTLPLPPHPAWNADHTISVIIAGEIFGYEDQKMALCQRGYAIDEGDTAQFIASLYQEEGEDFVRHLNGAFAIAIWDSQRQKLILANDRLGYEPLYYAQTPERFSFASTMGSLLADVKLSRNVNELAMAQSLTFDHVLGNHTLLKEVQLLPPGSILTLVDRQVSIRTYWQLNFPEHYSLHNQSEYEDELLALLRQTIRRQRPAGPAGVMLSGGLDSRVILALLCEVPLSQPLRAFTFGNSGCDDLRFARELAEKAQVPHEFYPLRPDYLIQQAERGIRLTDGMQNIVHMHTLDNLAAQAERAPFIYKGFLGDALTGYFSHRDFLSHYCRDDLLQSFFEHYPFVFKPATHTQLFAPEFLNKLQDDVFQTAYPELILSDDHHLAADLFFQFDLRQRQRRLTLNGVRLVRSQAVVRTPFYDNDVLDFMLRLPQGYRLERFLITQIFIRTFPELAKIPSTATNTPMMPCLRKSSMEIDERIRWRLRAAGLKWLRAPQKYPYASYDIWFRSVLRNWAEDILLSQRFLERGYFNPSYIRQLLDEHMAGQNHHQKLGALISIELWHRAFID